MADFFEGLSAIAMAMAFAVLVLVLGMGAQLNMDKEAVTKQFCQPMCAAGEVASVEKNDEKFVCSCTVTRKVEAP